MKQRWQVGLMLLGLAVILVAPRIFDLDAFRAPDEDRWMARANGFTRDLALGRWDELVKSPTPGITTQWLGAPTIRFDDWAVRKLPLALGQALLIGGVAYVFGRRWGFWTGVVVALVLALDPVLLGHTRIFGTDSLLALTLALAGGLLLTARGEVRYIIASGVAGAAAVWSKIPGGIIMPFSLSYLAVTEWRQQHSVPWRRPGLWLLGLGVGLVIILPTFALAPGSVIGDIMETFASEGYTELHTGAWHYYLGSLAFFSTPLLWLGLIVTTGLWRHWSRGERWQLGWLVGLAVVFVVGMSLGAKKGDRYILPALTLLNIVAAIGLGRLVTWAVTSAWPAWWRRFSVALLVLITVMVGQQLYSLVTLYPHMIAYVNPLTRSWFGARRHGWGEGLDVAAAYLNAKADASSLTVASYYPNEFETYFSGSTVPAHQHDESTVDYVVLYRAMLQRGEEAWETDVLNQYNGRRPEQVISFGGVPFVWIYAR